MGFARRQGVMYGDRANEAAPHEGLEAPLSFPLPRRWVVEVPRLWAGWGWRA
ncbi:hypothetical protein SAMN02745194_03622 [Roseomonas rosea]|uniref:Uncharacterized protein n=1 Tax=Muricoccus roseus TaxID=198092 RepID=A0A1M6MWL6_9PROT|nr:hypothetical protein [Roseomonas rosea]SHJ87780.1 hypothetical protein SAMN02745194_03622 [Roseomonas rosea]